MAGEDNFLSRWSRRKSEAKDPSRVQSPEPRREAAVPAAAAMPAPPAEKTPLPPIDTLTPESDFTPFMAPEVDGDLRRQALKTLFSDPHFNVMDGLDTYIDDYGKPDPIPDSMLRMMRQSQFLGLFDDEKKQEPAASGSDLAPELAAVPTAPTPCTVATAEPEECAHEDTDLRLQQDDAVGQPGPDQGPGA